MSDWAAWRERTDLAEYEARWKALAESGANPHGEADFVLRYVSPGASVLDAGCGTGRVGIELALRGCDVVGVDLDDDMLALARAKAPDVPWEQRDLADLSTPAGALGHRFDAVVLAGNVLRFVEPEARAAAAAGCAQHVAPGGYLIAGCVVTDAGPSLEDYDAWCAAQGLRLVDRFATWDGAPFVAEGADYAVSVHRAGA